MKPNPILEELYADREKLLADVGGDVHKFLEGVRKREAASGRLLITTLPRESNRSDTHSQSRLNETPLPIDGSVVEVDIAS